MNKPILLFAFLFLSSALFCQIADVEKINYRGVLKINISHPLYQEGQGVCNQKTQFLELPYRKLTYSDFTKIAVNDTSIAVIDLFFSKKENAVYNQMSLLPFSIVLFAIPPSRWIGVGTAMLSIPLFLNGSYILVKYRKKKLYKVLVDYQTTQTLPKWVRKRANKLLVHYNELEIEY